MFKHIKYKAEVCADGININVVILEQTYRGTSFGVGKCDSDFHAACGITLESVACPENDLVRDSLRGTVYMRGNCATDDLRPIKFTVAEYAKFKEAVLEYNELFKE